MVLLRTVILLFIFFPSILFAEDVFQKLDDSRFITKSAVVDIESVLEHSIAIANIKKSISKISDEIQKEFTDKEIDLKKLESELINKQESISEKEFKLQLDEFNKKVSETQKEMHSKKNALEQAYGAANSQVHTKIVEIIRDLSKKHGFNIVFPSTQILFVENNMNITLEVIDNLNKTVEDIGIKYIPHN